MPPGSAGNDEPDVLSGHYELRGQFTVRHTRCTQASDFANLCLGQPCAIVAFALFLVGDAATKSIGNCPNVLRTALTSRRCASAASSMVGQRVELADPEPLAFLPDRHRHHLDESNQRLSFTQRRNPPRLVQMRISPRLGYVLTQSPVERARRLSDVPNFPRGRIAECVNRHLLPCLDRHTADSPPSFWHRLLGGRRDAPGCRPSRPHGLNLRPWNARRAAASTVGLY